MSQRNSVSVLNELSQSRCIRLSFDIKSIGTITRPFFECECKFGLHTEVVQALSKKVAKEECAKLMLKNNNLIKNSSDLNTSVPFENYIGELNEFCSGYALQYPEYVEIDSSTGFCVKCTHSGNEILATASNKKQAKQNAALKMLELLKSKKKLEVKVIPKPVETKQINILDEEIIDKFNTLKLNSTHLKDAITNDSSNLDIMQDKTKELLSKFKINILQEDPMILVSMLKTNPRICYMAKGSSFDDAYANLVGIIFEAHSNS